MFLFVNNFFPNILLYMTLKRFSLFLAIIILPLGITIFWGYETLRESDTSL